MVATISVAIAVPAFILIIGILIITTIVMIVVYWIKSE